MSSAGQGTVIFPTIRFRMQADDRRALPSCSCFSICINNPFETAKMRAMSSSLRESLALVMFVIFMANLGLWNFHMQLEHELDHTGHPALALQGAAHVHAQDQHHGDTSECDENAPTASQHQLLHAVDNVQPNFGGVIAHNVKPPHNVTGFDFQLPLVPSAASESPFRPPRSSPSIG